MTQAIQPDDAPDADTVPMINRPADGNLGHQLFGVAAQIGCLIILGLLYAGPASAEDGRITVIEENDSILFDSDRYYTQGLQLNYLGSSVDPVSGWNAPFDLFADHIGIFPHQGASGGAVDRRYELLFGQQIFTPENIHLKNPDAGDRPYAGWLYGGVGLLQDTDHRQLDHLEIQAGVVGPSSLAHQTQNDWHQFIGIDQAAGWREQLHNEPGFLISYEHKWRFLQPVGGGYAVDAIPQLGATAGNIMTYASAGTLFRFGRNLEADYGPARMQPAMSGSSYFNSKALDGPFGFYVYAGAQGRAVARNIFLDGNTFEDSNSADKKVLVGDLIGGVSLFWSDTVKLDTSVIYRSKEFSGQDKDEKYAGFNLSFGL